ncbi:hypothetical protein F4861DRAFT_430709 [Xylaria intraflava]|nr:hypothetical protein F4861DRAFT_430709 [Xylaria intraflava]
MAKVGSSIPCAIVGQPTPMPRTRSSPTSPAEPSKHSSIYSDISHARSSSPDSEENEFYDAHELFKAVPQGFPSLAAMKAQWSKFRTFRTFDYLNWRLMDRIVSQLDYLENELYKLDTVESRNMNGLQRSRVPFDKKVFADCSLTPSEPSHKFNATELDTQQEKISACREKIFAHIERILEKHRGLAAWIEHASELPRTHRTTHEQLFASVQEIHDLKGEAIENYRAVTDRVPVGVSQLEYRLEILWQSIPYSIKDFLRRCLGKPALPDNGGTLYYTSVSECKIKLLCVVFAVLFVISVVVTPSGILYLGQPEEANAFVIWLIFGAIFAIPLLFVEQPGRAIVGIVAYMAMLATVMPNV